MHLELLREKAREFPDVKDPTSYSTARIWHCRYGTLKPVGALTGLRKLTIATYPDQSLAILSGLVKLQDLEIIHLPGVKSLTPLASLTALRKLALRTLPSWDASGKKTVVESLAPISQLPMLEELELIGVVPESGKVDDLLGACSNNLRRVKVSKYPKLEQERIRARFAA